MKKILRRIFWTGFLMSIVRLMVETTLVQSITHAINGACFKRERCKTDTERLVNNDTDIANKDKCINEYWSFSIDTNFEKKDTIFLSETKKSIELMLTNNSVFDILPYNKDNAYNLQLEILNEEGSVYKKFINEWVKAWETINITVDIEIQDADRIKITTKTSLMLEDWHKCGLNNIMKNDEVFVQRGHKKLDILCLDLSTKDSPYSCNDFDLHTEKFHNYYRTYALNSLAYKSVKVWDFIAEYTIYWYCNTPEKEEYLKEYLNFSYNWASINTKWWLDSFIDGLENVTSCDPYKCPENGSRIEDYSIRARKNQNTATADWPPLNRGVLKKSLEDWSLDCWFYIPDQNEIKVSLLEAQWI